MQLLLLNICYNRIRTVGVYIFKEFMPKFRHHGFYLGETDKKGREITEAASLVLMSPPVSCWTTGHLSGFLVCLQVPFLSQGPGMFQGTLETVWDVTPSN